MSSEYDFAQTSSLKLKGVSDGGISKKKKKKCKKSKHEEREEPSASSSKIVEEPKDSSNPHQFYSKKTKAEIAFIKKKETADAERIRKKAAETHKERVEKFNNYLNSLSEHYEQSKVSWTK